MVPVGNLHLGYPLINGVEDNIVNMVTWSIGHVFLET